MRKVKITKRDLLLKENVLVVMEKVVTPYGNGAKVDCVKEYIGRRAYIIVVKD
jgi:putative transposon-encoded protein